MITRLSTTILLAAALCLSACASLNATKAPGVDLSRIKTVYVQKLIGEEWDIDKLIAKRLQAMGYEATNGNSDTPPSPVEAIVTYEDRWMWDLSMYMIKLNIQVRDGANRAILASAESYRPSLQRKSPEAMVEEVLNEIFKK